MLAISSKLRNSSAEFPQHSREKKKQNLLGFWGLMISINAIILPNYMICEVYRFHPWRHGYPADIRHPVGGFRRPVPSGLRVLEAGNPLSPSAATGTNSGPKNMKFLNFGPLPRLTRQKSALAKILRSNDLRTLEQRWWGHHKGAYDKWYTCNLIFVQNDGVYNDIRA